VRYSAYIRVFLAVIVYALIFVVVLLSVSRFVLFNSKVGDSTSQKENDKLNVTKSPQSLKVIFTGDVMMGRSVRNKVKELNDYAYPFANISDYLSAFDIVFVNLENPFAEECPFHDSGYKFCSDPESVATLKYGSVDIVSIANNHTGNYGKASFELTKKTLNGSGIEYVGDKNLVIKEVNGTKFGFLGFDFTVKKPTAADIELVHKSDGLADILIVAPHWGVEYKADPEEYQRGWAKLFVQNGADLIIGSHPHWVQGVDCVSGGNWQYFDRENTTALTAQKCEQAVFYSLGNFVFDQMWSEETKKGILAEFVFQKNKISEIKVHKIYIQNVGQPIIVK